MITQSDEYFAANWTECLYVVEDAKIAMGNKDPSDDKWEQALMDKWIVKPDEPDPEPEPEPDPDAPPPTEEEVKAKEAAKKEKEEAEAAVAEQEEADRLMGKYKKWSEIRKFLWEYYCPDDGIRHQHELDSRAPWESDEED